MFLTSFNTLETKKPIPKSNAIAKITFGSDAILFAPGPKVAADKAAEYRGPTGHRTFPLQGIVKFFYGVRHA